MKSFLLAFDFEKGNMNSYIINFLEKHQIDFYYQMPGVLVADLFGTNKYYRLEVEDVVNKGKKYIMIPVKFINFAV